MSDFHFENDLNVTRETTIFFRAATDGAKIGKRKDRLAMIGMHLTRTRGGISTLTSAILNSSLAADYDITYIASQAEDFGKLRKVMLAFVSGIRFLGFCAFARPVAVYVHVGSNASLYRESLFVLLSKALGNPTILHFHAGDIEYYLKRQPGIGQRFIKYALGLGDRVVAVSEGSKCQLIRFVRSDTSISVIPNTISTEAFRSMVRGPKKRADHVRLLFVGAVGKLKGEKDLIKALDLLRARGLSLKVDIVGSGADRLAAQVKAAGLSSFIGHLGPASMDERLALFERADIFVLPTYAEAMPVSVIEAMAAGLAIVTTPVGGIPELIDDGKQGFLINPGDTQALAEKIELLIRDPQARFTLGDNARRRVAQRPDLDEYIERLRTEIAAVRTR